MLGLAHVRSRVVVVLHVVHRGPHSRCLAGSARRPSRCRTWSSVASVMGCELGHSFSLLNLSLFHAIVPLLNVVKGCLLGCLQNCSSGPMGREALVVLRGLEVVPENVDEYFFSASPPSLERNEENLSVGVGLLILMISLWRLFTDFTSLFCRLRREEAPG